MSIPKKYLTEKVILTESHVDGNSILRILTQNNSIDRSNPNIKYYEQLANWADKHQNKTGPINLDTITLSDDSLITENKLKKSANHLGHILNQLKKLMTKEGKYDSKSARSSLIQKTTLEILAGFSGIKNDVTPTETDAGAPKEEHTKADSPSTEKLYQGMDWTAEKARRLSNTEGKTTSEILEQFYNDYYSIEYAGVTSPEKDTEGIVAKLKSLDSVLVQEFNKLGYNPDVNPFAQFLKNLITLQKDKKSVIFSKLTTNTYGAIHNSFIRGYITGDMLGKLDESSNTNILFCTDLYNYRGLDIVNYLALQNTIRKKAAKDKEYSSNPWLLTTKVLIQQNQPGATFAEKVTALKDSKEVILPVHENAKMRATSEINELDRYLFSDQYNNDDTVESEDDVPENDEVREDKKLTEIVGRAKYNKVVLSMIRFILDQPNFKKEYPKHVTVYEKWLSEIQYKRNDRNIEKSRTILTAEDFKVSTEDMPKLIKKLIAVYNRSQKAK